MIVLFYISSFIAIASVLMVITRKNAIHALLYLIFSFLAISVIIYLTGSPFIAILEILIYAGAIMTLFVFVVMMLNLPATAEQEKKWMKPSVWIVPVIMVITLLVEFVIITSKAEHIKTRIHSIGSKEVGTLLFSSYLPLVELAGILLMIAIIGAYHLGIVKKKNIHRYLKDTPQ